MKADGERGRLGDGERRAGRRTSYLPVAPSPLPPVFTSSLIPPPSSLITDDEYRSADAGAGRGGQAQDEGDGRARESRARRRRCVARLDGRGVPRPHAGAFRAARAVRPRSRVPRRPAHRRPPLGRGRCDHARTGHSEGARRQERHRSIRRGDRADGRGSVPRGG